MAPDLGRTKLRRVIIHDVPKHSSQPAADVIRYSETDSPLSDELKLLLRTKIVEGCSPKGSYDVFLSTDLPSPVPALINSYMGDPGGFVEISKRIAEHLYNSQPTVSPAGLVAVIDAMIGGLPSIAILKLEREEGIQLEEVERNGLRSFSLEHLRNLIVTEKTKLQKLGLFVADSDSPEGVWARVCDRQRGFEPNTEVAEFFLSRFLGAKLVGGAPMVATARMLDATERFINEHVPDPETRSAYGLAILVELANQSAVVSPREFADRNLMPQDRQAYLDALEAAEVPTTLFDKDISNVKNRIRRMYVVLDNDVMVSAPQEKFSDVVDVSRLENGQTEVRAKGFLRKVGGA